MCVAVLILIIYDNYFFFNTNMYENNKYDMREWYLVRRFMDNQLEKFSRGKAKRNCMQK